MQLSTVAPGQPSLPTLSSVVALADHLTVLEKLLPDDPQRSSDLRLWVRFFGLTFAVGVPSVLIFRPKVHDLVWLLVVGAATAVLVLGGPSILRERFPKLGAVWPGFVTLIALGAAGWVATGIGPVLGEFYAMTYVYIGVTRRPGSAVKLIPLGIASWLVANAPLTTTVLAKVPVLAVVWMVLGELLSKVTAERVADRHALAHLAAHDALTGLFNRHGLDQRLEELRGGDSVVVLDLDFFKNINDTFGHTVGDRVLADLGRAVLGVLRADDTAVRYGGEEILLLLPHAAPKDVDACLGRLRAAWSVFHPEITFSAGTAVVDESGAPAALAAADRAMYQAKSAGRARTVHSAPAPPTLPSQRRAIGSALVQPGVLTR